MADLETATTDEIFDEISKRYPAAVLCLEVMGKVDSEDLRMWSYNHGSWATCIGLCERLKYRMLVKGNPNDE